MKLGNWPKFQKLHVYNLYYSRVQILLRFALRSLVFQIIEVFGFSIGYNGEFKIFEKKIVKISKKYSIYNKYLPLRPKF